MMVPADAPYAASEATSGKEQSGLIGSAQKRKKKPPRRGAFFLNRGEVSSHKKKKSPAEAGLFNLKGGQSCSSKSDSKKQR